METGVVLLIQPETVYTSSYLHQLLMIVAAEIFEAMTTEVYLSCECHHSVTTGKLHHDDADWHHNKTPLL